MQPETNAQKSGSTKQARRPDLNAIIQPTIQTSLQALNLVSGSPLLDTLGLRKPAEELLYQVTRLSVSTGNAVAGQAAAARRLLPGGRLKKPGPRKDGLFNLNLDEDQAMTRDMVEKYAVEVLRPAARQADEERKLPENFLEDFHQTGLTGMGISSEADGVAEERRPVSNMLLVEDLSHGDMSLAIAALSNLSFVNILNDFGSHDQLERFLHLFTTEELVTGTTALIEKRPFFDPYRLETRANRNHSGYILNGSKSQVALAETADYIMVWADLAERGIRAFIVDTKADGLTVEPEYNMGLKGSGLCSLKLDNVFVPAENLLGESELDYDHTRLLSLGKIALAALAVGTAQSVVDYVISYCNQREAFGEVISHRQSVAFMIADMATELEGMRMMTWRAAARAEEGLPFTREAALAWRQACDYGMKIGTDGVQLLGGHGFIREHMVELWYRQLRAIATYQNAFII